MSELVDFLTQRLAEDEAVARAASPGPWRYGDVESVAGGTLYDATRRIADLAYEQPGDHDGTIVRHLLSDEADANGAHIARHDPARVLREVTAKRAILALHEGYEKHGGGYWCGQCADGAYGDKADWPCDTVRALAAPFSDHPDFQEQWR